MDTYHNHLYLMWYFAIKKLSVLFCVVYPCISCNMFVVMKSHANLYFQILCLYFGKYKVIISPNLYRRLNFGLSLIGHQKNWEILSSGTEDCFTCHSNTLLLFWGGRYPKYMKNHISCTYLKRRIPVFLEI